jgi:hypothetical protein
MISVLYEFVSIGGDGRKEQTDLSKKMSLQLLKIGISEVTVTVTNSYTITIATQ